ARRGAALDAGARAGQPAHLPRRGGAGAVQRRARGAGGVAGSDRGRPARRPRPGARHPDDPPQHLRTDGPGRVPGPSSWTRVSVGTVTVVDVQLTESDARALVRLSLPTDAALRRMIDEPTVGRGLDYARRGMVQRSEEHTSELQSRENLVCRL